MYDTYEHSKEGFLFDAKPDVIPYNYRISYKVSILCVDT